MFKLKRKKIQRMKDVFEIEAHNIVRLVDEKLNVSFDLICETNDLRTEIRNQNLKIKELKTEIKLKDKQLKEKDEYNQKLYEYAYKLATIIKADNQKLLDEIADLKSDRYLKVEVPEGKTPKGQKIGIKSGTKTSKIIKKVKED